MGGEIGHFLHLGPQLPGLAVHGIPASGSRSLWLKFLDGNPVPCNRLIFPGGTDSRDYVIHHELDKQKSSFLSILESTPAVPGTNFCDLTWVKPSLSSTNGEFITTSNSPFIGKGRKRESNEGPEGEQQGTRRPLCTTENPQDGCLHSRNTYKPNPSMILSLFSFLNH